ncbi:MAG: T9SS type A sorting domain-containing protein [Chitinophagales bacterium]|nr:T9SS type A sorting domain-containing protein [Chitinophagales bacterium]
MGGKNSQNGSQIPFITTYGNIKIAVDNRNGTWTEQSIEPFFKIVNRPASKVNIVVPTVIKLWESTKVKIVALDDNNNVAKDFNGTIRLSCSDNLSNLPEAITFTPSDNGYKEIFVKFNTSGEHYIEGLLDGVKSFKSNYAYVTVNKDFDILWGDLHSHSAFSRDGMGSCAYEYAKYASCLDFYSATEHADQAGDKYGIDSLEWQEIIDCSLFYESPGEFIPLLGYEISDKAPTGHYQFIYNYSNNNIGKIPMWNNAGEYEIMDRYASADSIDANIQVMAIPHHSGKDFNDPMDEKLSVNFFGGAYASNKYKRVIEIFSHHGLSEAYNPQHPLSYENIENKNAHSNEGPHYAQDAWALNERLGVIASSDNHTSQPGVVAMVAVVTNDKSRDGIFKALYNRNCYGTTGERIAVDFTINGFKMGNILNSITENPSIEYNVLGTDTLEYIEILKWDFVNGTYENNHPKFEVILHQDLHSIYAEQTFTDLNYQNNSMYYLRVKQKNKPDDNESWAWSSPIWVNKSEVTTIFNHTQQKFALFPNPVFGNGSITIVLPDNIRGASLTIYNLLGEDLLHEEIQWNNTRIELPNLSSGCYLVSLYDTAHRLVGSEKLLIK